VTSFLIYLSQFQQHFTYAYTRNDTKMNCDTVSCGRGSGWGWNWRVSGSAFCQI